MSPKQLSYFLRISELGSFSKAAAVLYIAQPALSRQIKHLEEELGVKLFERSDAGIYLTAAGRLLSDRAKALLSQIESVRNEISTIALRMQGNVALGVPPSFFGLVTTRLVEELRNQYPDVRLTVVEGISSTLHELLLGGQLDLAIVALSSVGTNLECRKLVGEPLFLGYQRAADVQLREDGTVGLEELAKRPLVLTSAPNAARAVLDSALRAHAVRPHIALESNSTRVLVDAASRGLGCSVLPYSALHEAYESGRVQVAPIDKLWIDWGMVFLRERGLSAVGQRLFEMIGRTSREHVESGIWLRGVV